MNILCIILAAILAPFFIGIVNQTKAFFGGRRGPGLFRLYADIRKLLGKSCPRFFMGPAKELPIKAALFDYAALGFLAR